MLQMIVLAITTSLALSATSLAVPAGFARVIDGDTVNISGQRIRLHGIDTPEAIYHMPGGRWYDKTVITASKGEKWFCSEGQARAVGWRRSRC